MVYILHVSRPDFAQNTGFILYSLIFSFPENSSAPKQELFSFKNNSFPFI